MKEENKKRLIAASKGIIPDNFYFEIEDGWIDIVEGLIDNIVHHLSRWREVRDIKEKILAKGEQISPNYEWINEYFKDNVEDPLPHFSIHQIKEKFGGLRCYYSPCDDYIDGLVSMAESMSWKTCYFCGNPGKISTAGYWIVVTCEVCKKEK